MHRVISLSLQAACIAFLSQIVTCLHVSLDSRQTNSSVPTQCQSICDPVVSILENCIPQQCCTNVFIGNLTSCFECVGNATDATNYSSPQSVLDQLFVECAVEGLTIDDPTLPGQNPNRTLSGLSTSSQSSFSFTQITISSINLPTPTFTQSTVTVIPSSTTPSATSPSAPASSSNTAFHCSWSWGIIIGGISALWVSTFMSI